MLRLIRFDFHILPTPTLHSHDGPFYTRLRAAACHTTHTTTLPLCPYTFYTRPSFVTLLPLFPLLVIYRRSRAYIYYHHFALLFWCLPHTHRLFTRRSTLLVPLFRLVVPHDCCSAVGALPHVCGYRYHVIIIPLVLTYFTIVGGLRCDLLATTHTLFPHTIYSPHTRLLATTHYLVGAPTLFIFCCCRFPYVVVLEFTFTGSTPLRFDLLHIFFHSIPRLLRWVTFSTLRWWRRTRWSIIVDDYTLLVLIVGTLFLRLICSFTLPYITGPRHHTVTTTFYVHAFTAHLLRSHTTDSALRVPGCLTFTVYLVWLIHRSVRVWFYRWDDHRSFPLIHLIYVHGPPHHTGYTSHFLGYVHGRYYASHTPPTLWLHTLPPLPSFYYLCHTPRHAHTFVVLGYLPCTRVYIFSRSFGPGLHARTPPPHFRHALLRVFCCLPLHVLRCCSLRSVRSAVPRLHTTHTTTLPHAVALRLVPTHVASPERCYAFGYSHLTTPHYLPHTPHYTWILPHAHSSTPRVYPPVTAVALLLPTTAAPSRYVRDFSFSVVLPVPRVSYCGCSRFDFVIR